LAGVSIAAVTGYRGVAEKVPARKLAAELALIVGPAILVALPFLSSIVGRYHLRIRNPVPLVWQDSAIPAALSQMAWDVMVSRWPVNIVILSGIAAIAWRRNSRRAAIMVLTWLGASVGLFVYNHYFVLDASGQIALPLSVPAHHFLVYGRAGGMLLFGLGVSVIASGAGWMAWRSIRGRFGRARLEPMQHAVSLLLVAAIVWHNYPAFLARDAFGPERDLARSRFTTVELRTVTPWIRANTEPSDVFLTAESACLSIVSTAGRKCVVAPRFFSNPYVDWGARSVAGQAMWDALMADDCAGFRLQAYAYRVTYVMTVETRTPQVPPGRCGLRPTSFPGSSWRIYRAFWN
jgi:hypothetical protein